MPAKNVLARGDHLRGDAACREPKESGKFTLMLMVAKRLIAVIRALGCLFNRDAGTDHVTNQGYGKLDSIYLISRVYSCIFLLCRMAVIEYSMYSSG
jgi:hypothetical protein